MVDLAVEDTEIVATGRTGTTVTVGVDGWTADDDPRSLSVADRLPVDERVSGRVTRLRLPATVSVESPDVEVADYVDPSKSSVELFRGQHRLSGSTSLPEADYRLTLQVGELVVYVEFEGSTDLRRLGYADWVVSFDRPTRVALGVRDTSNAPVGTVTVPPTPAGLARAVSAFPAGLRTTTPDRSYISLRRHPPRVEFGDRTHVPETVAAAAEETRTGVELAVPDRTTPLFLLAPLSYYLGASVTVEDRDRPLLRTPAAGVERSLPRAPALQWAAADLLRRVVRLDVLVRNAGPHGADLLELERARSAGLDLDTAALYGADPQERLRRYLAVDDRPLDAAFPQWPSAVCVDPTVEHAGVLPSVASRLATVYLAGAVRESVGPTVSAPDREFASPPPSGSGSAPASTPSDPGSASTPPSPRPPTETPAPGPDGERVVGWLSDDPPPAVDADPEGPRHGVSGRYEVDVGAVRRWSARDPDPPVEVVVVGADAAVADRIGRRSDVGQRVVVEHLPAPSRAALDRALAAGPDLLYVVDRVVDGEVVCADGTAPPADLPAGAVDAVVLDAPRSGRAAAAFVDRGSLVGIGRGRPGRGDGSGGSDREGERPTEGGRGRGDAEAPEGRVCPTVVESLLFGLSAPDAVWVARRYGDTAGPVRVVGAGADGLPAAPQEVRYLTQFERGDDGYDYRGILLTTAPGGLVALHPDDLDPVVTTDGRATALSIAPERMPHTATDSRMPSVHDGRIYWPSERWQFANPLL